MDTNILIAQFTDYQFKRTRSLYQYDYGQILKFEGIDLPVAYEVHFSTNNIGGSSITQIGDEDGVTIPDELLLSGKTIYAWVYLHAGENDGETMYAVTIPVTVRPMPSNDTPTPVQQDAITQAIAALNAAVEQTEQDVIDTNAAKVAAEAAQIAAETAQGKAEDAQGAAETAQSKAETAQGKAEAAQTAAETAQGLAEDARDAAQGYAGDAADSATRAEQAASTAGYMKFEIDERGHLIYTRVGFHDTMFSLVDGHLILGVA